VPKASYVECIAQLQLAAVSNFWQIWLILDGNFICIYPVLGEFQGRGTRKVFRGRVYIAECTVAVTSDSDSATACDCASEGAEADVRRERVGCECAYGSVIMAVM
jgi:hypothetical protein